MRDAESRARPTDPRSGSTDHPAAPRGGGAYGRMLVWWVDQVRRFAWPVVLVTLLTAIAGGYETVSHLQIRTDPGAMISSDLPYRKIGKAFDVAFPQLGDNLVIVVEAATADQAEDAARLLDKKLKARTDLFGSVFFPGGDSFFRDNGLLYLDLPALQSLSDRLADAQPLMATLARDMSLRGLFGVLGLGLDEVAKGKQDPGPFVRTIGAIGDTVAARLAGRRARLSWRALMSATPLTAGDMRQIILAHLRPAGSELARTRTAIAAVRRIAAELDPGGASGLRVRITGGPALELDELGSVKKGMGFAAILSLVLVSVIVSIGLRSPKLVFAALATLVVGLVWTATFATLAIGYLNLISVAFAVLFIGLAVDFSIQFGLRYKEGIDAGLAHRVALRTAAANTGVAVGLAALSAAIGFFAFVPTNYIGLAELGLIAGVGMFIGYAATMTVLPALLTVMPISPSRRTVARKGATAFGRGQERHARAIAIGALILGLAALATVPLARFDIDPINLKDPTTESVKTFRELARSSKTSPYSINVLAPNLDAAEALAKRLDKLSVVDETVTLRSLVPKNQEEKLDIIDQMALFLTPVLDVVDRKALPTAAERRAAVRQFRARLGRLLASSHGGALTAPAKRLTGLLDDYAKRAVRMDPDYAKLDEALLANLPGRLAALRAAMNPSPITLANLPQNLRRRYVTPDGRARVEVYPAKTLTEGDNLRVFVTAVRAVAPMATDMPVDLLEGGNVVIHAFQEGGVLAFVLISTLLIFVLRNLMEPVLVLLPLALAGVLTVALTVILGVPFNFANVIALPLLLSLGVAFGIYLVMRYRETGRVSSLLRTSTPRAVLFSALTTMASFSSLMFSSHRGTASMGLLLAIGLTLALICTLLVLPALLAWRGGEHGAAAEGDDIAPDGDAPRGGLTGPP